MTSSDFLRAERVTDWVVEKPPSGYVPECVYTGKDPDFNMPLEVAVTQTNQVNPTREALQKLHKARVGNRGYPLIVAAITSRGTWLFGPNASAVPTGPFDHGQAQRLLQAALDEPNQVAAVNRLGQFRQPADSNQELGVTNSGLFASHHIRQNVPNRSDWSPACDKSKPILSKSGTDLIKALGFTVQKSSADTLVLAGSSASPRAVAVLLNDSEQFESRADRYQVSPVAYGLKKAAEQDVPWLILLRGGQIRLYPAKDGVGVGQRGQSDTFFELDLSLLSDEMSGLLYLIFSAEALAQDGTTQQILTDSARYATDLGVRLKNRIYDHVVPELAKAVAAQLPTLKVAVDADGLQLAYRLTLRILFRLLFQAYAEDRGLLPFGRNPRYDRNALKTLVTEDLIPSQGSNFDSESQTLWDDLEQVWRVIDKGDKAWGVPAYNGGLFGADEALHPEGALINHIRLTNDVMGTVLDHMLIDISEDGVRGPVDFRSLSVREFGTIYEGLLESSLSLADQDLTVDTKGAWVPAKDGETVDAPAGSVYFHSASGERKATGSYFTPSIIVEHLLDRALEPALQQHLDKVSQALDAGDEAKAHEIFFDFRVADLAMGSGHFLVAAVDRIETAMRNFLVDRNVPGVTNELIKLEAAAIEALGADFEFSGDIDRAGLLRRQVARRCIYGLDINPLAVELARLALWIHTFVPGLPMSSLDHGLVCANSLTGIGTVEEALKELDPAVANGETSLFSFLIEDALNDAKDLLINAANASEATAKEVKEAAKTAAKAREAALPTKYVFDAAVAARLGVGNALNFVDAETLYEIGASDDVQAAVAPLNPAHMPYLFPEVFLRENPGFDVLLGNPPWEKMHVNTEQWWNLKFPGLKLESKSDRELAIQKLGQNRPELLVELEMEIEKYGILVKAVSKGPYPGIGAAHIDLYAAFAWRNTGCCREFGFVGLLVPRTAFAGASLEQWRRATTSHGSFVELATLKNSRRWMFDIAEQYTVAAFAYNKNHLKTGDIWLSGPFASAEELVLGSSSQRSLYSAEQINQWSDSFAIPSLPSIEAFQIFATMRQHRNFSEVTEEMGGFRPVQGDINQTTNSSLIQNSSVEESDESLDIWTGRTFNLWELNSGATLGHARRLEVETFLNDKRNRTIRNRASATFGLSPMWASDSSTLPVNHPRITFRDICRATDPRTVIAVLAPPRIVLVESTPYLFRRNADKKAEAYLLGVMSSCIFDWYAKFFVELHFKFYILNSMPLPDFDYPEPKVSRLVLISGRLAAVDDRYSEWAAEVGVPVGSVTDDEIKNDLVAELDALVALLYGLDESQVTHIFETFHRGWDYKPRLEAVLGYYAKWKDKS